MKYIFYGSLLSLTFLYSVDGSVEASCGANEIYHECQPCAAVDCFESPPIFCTDICQNPGCYCKPGYLRKDGVCVPEQACSDVLCGPNENYLECEPCAAINCGDTPPEVCLAVCWNPGCYCKPGYLRKNGVCIPEQSCNTGICGLNEIYLECQPCAAINCGDKDPEACIAICRNPGCYCKPGYLRRNGVCVPKQSCPRALCGKNEVYHQCQPCAAINCGDTPPEVCIEVCQNPGCYCEKGYLRKDGVCVPEHQCFSYHG